MTFSKGSVTPLPFDILALPTTDGDIWEAMPVRITVIFCILVHSNTFEVQPMKRLVFFAALCLFIGHLRAQSTVELNLSMMAGGVPLGLNQDFLDHSGKATKLSRLHFYLCNFELVHDGGQVTPIANTYLLVSPARITYSLGTVNGVTQVEKVRFSVGVDANVNHDDPSGWPSTHPLSYQTPSQHWGWSSGYLFSTLEGRADSDNNGTTDRVWEIHTLGDALLRDQEIAVTPQTAGSLTTLSLEYDVQAWLRDLDLATVGVQHASTGAALTSANNITTYSVFRNAGTVGVTEPQYVPLLAFDMFDAEHPVIYWDAKGVEAVSLQVHDLNGAVVFRAAGLATAGRQRVDAKLAAGMYVCTLLHNGAALQSKKFQVRR